MMVLRETSDRWPACQIHEANYQLDGAKNKFGINGVCHKLKDSNKNTNFMTAGTQNIQHCLLNGVCFPIIFKQNQLIPSEWALKFTVAVVTTWVAGSTDISYTQTF